MFVFICVFGFGLFFGVFVIVVGEIGVFVKFYVEVIENIFKKFVEGVVVFGGFCFQVICFGMLL